MAVDRRRETGVLNGKISIELTTCGPESNSESITSVLIFSWSITMAIRFLYKLQYGFRLLVDSPSKSSSVGSSVCNASKPYTDSLLANELSTTNELFNSIGLSNRITSSGKDDIDEFVELSDFDGSFDWFKSIFFVDCFISLVFDADEFSFFFFNCVPPNSHLLCFSDNSRKFRLLLVPVLLFFS